jgi:ATP-dependent exoDNAse (exonuclease V) beta subunit
LPAEQLTLALAPPPPDQPARDRVAQALDETLFVEAGAGSGKTSALVRRFVALVEAGVPADRIAAITFTEQAARELGDRVRGELAEAAVASPRCAAALEVVDRAAICTLHAFAQRTLTEHPVEAKLPPRLSVLDEIASEEVFERRWEVMVDRMLEDPALEMPLRILVACGRGVDTLRDLALAFRDNWDRLRAQPSDASPIAVDVTDLLAALSDLVDLADGCIADGDRLLGALDGLRSYRDRLAAAGPPDERVRLLQDPEPAFRPGNAGQQQAWPGHDTRAIRDRIRAADERRQQIVASAASAAVRRLGGHLAAFTLEGAEQRRHDGTLEFHDLLVMARSLVRDPGRGPAVRRALGARYQCLLIDEFQDTDPIQVELALLLASEDPADGGREWQEMTPRQGALFFVGDPKQSIYRFRRADIATFLAARDRMADDVVRLTANFRSTAGIVAWVNATFGRLITELPGRQAAYVPLDSERDNAPAGPPVGLVGTTPLPPATKAAQTRAAEAAAVARVVQRAIAERWSVREGTGWRAAHTGDVCILVPARTSLPFLERALDAASIPYRAETSSLVYATREVRDLLAVARAVDDATDQLSLLTALRSAAFGCGDDDLFSWRQLGGSWDHQAPTPAGADGHPVGSAMAWLGALHRERTWMAASAVLDRIVRDRRILEVACARPRPRDLWRRIRFVVDQARAWEETAGGSLRDYLRWVRRQGSASSRVVETVLPETDEQSVRIMTIHAAKGLEFPIVVLSGMTSRAGGRVAGVEVLWTDRGWEARLGGGVATDRFDDAKPIDEQMDDDERRRLLYVAATRARDHLVVSVHRVEQPKGGPTAAELLWGAQAPAVDLDGEWTTADVPVGAADAAGDTAGAAAGDAAAGDVAAADGAPPASAGLEYPSLPDWQVAFHTAVVQASRRLTTSATRLAEEVAARRQSAEAAGDPGLAKDARDLELPAWQKGRYGSAIGRAVHAVLQTVDLATGAGLSDAAAAQAAAEEVLGREALIAALARAALGSTIVRDAATRQHWRELYVGAPVGATVLEGYIDLLLRTEDGLVIVDYKTDAVGEGSDLEAKVARYRPQLAAYAAAVETAVGEPVARAVLLFLAPTGARTVEVPSLAEAVAEVRGELASSGSNSAAP